MSEEKIIDGFIVVNSPTLDLLEELVKKNDYIKDYRLNKKKEPSSLAYIIKRDMSQRDCIKLATGIEKLFTDLILETTSLKQKQQLFIDEKKKIVYYAEQRADINLDTHKSKATYKSCLATVEQLKKDFPDYSIKWCLLGYRYIASEHIPTDILKKYLNISQNLYGVNDYFEMLGIDFKFTEESYSYYINSIAEEMFANE